MVQIEHLSLFIGCFDDGIGIDKYFIAWFELNFVFAKVGKISGKNANQCAVGR